MNKNRIFDRDKYKCCLCGSGQRIEPVPHHCFFKSEYFEKDRDDDWNLITICMFCHNQIHQKGNRKKEKLAKQIAISRKDSDVLLKIMKEKRFLS